MENGWFNATSAAKIFGKRPYHWLELDETKEYLFQLNKQVSAGTADEQNQWVITRKGSPEKGYAVFALYGYCMGWWGLN